MLGCSTSKDFPEGYKGRQIHFGQGGGFSGVITHFALLEDGRVFQKEYRDTTFTPFATWDRDFVDQMFLNYHRLNLDKVDHYHPGNLYYFIEYHAHPAIIHRISWGQQGYSPDENIVTFYNLLYRSTKSKS